jgi:transposase
MNLNANKSKKQVAGVCVSKKYSRAELRRQEKEKAKREKSKTHFDETLMKKADEIVQNLKAQTWRELETKGKFNHDRKLTFIKDDMLILGCDIGSETHYFRAIDTKGIELSRKAMAFPNNEEGYKEAKKWAVDLAARNDKTQIVLGLEPTGHYWFTITAWMVANGISVVQVNPYAVKCTKELSDNSQLKDDRKDPKVIAELVKNGNYGMPYLPEGVYAELRRLTMYRDQLMEDRIRDMNRLHREVKIYFPEYKELFGKIDGAFSLSLLKEASMPEDLISLGEDGIREIWKKAGLKGRGYAKASEVITKAEGSIGLKEGTAAGRRAVSRFAGQVQELKLEIDEVEALVFENCKKIPHAGNVLEVPGIGETILSGILAEMGDISRFDDVKELQKLSGLGLVACSSGKHQGETKISRRGRRRLRYWLYQGAKCVVAHTDEFREMHNYYTTRAKNPLKKMQSLIVIACKLLRVICAILKTGKRYDPERMKRDIVRMRSMEVA